MSFIMGHPRADHPEGKPQQQTVNPIPPQLCPECNIYRTSKEFAGLGLTHKKCAVCRSKGK